MKKILLSSIATLFIIGCGPSSSKFEEEPEPSSTTQNTATEPTSTPSEGTGNLNILGKITYERVQPHHSDGFSALNYNDVTREAVKEVLVEALDANNLSLARSYTDNEGNYKLTGIPASTKVKVRLYAKMYKSDTWDLKVVDNTHNGAIYVVEGSLVDMGTDDSKRDLTAPLRSDASSPFAILDSIHQAMKKVQTADSKVTFPELKVNWSVNNAPTGTFNPSLGQIPTTYYSNKNIYVLGDKNSDSDEFDNHILIHEWGHYFEDILSRTDSIGGSHGAGDKLDIRVAFGEGWGNAFSAIATDDPIYFDTSSNGQTGWNMNIESQEQNAPGYFSEASIQRILYDIYDDNDDGSDSLSMGFKPMYKVLVGAEKITPAFTSLFTFIDALKNENASKSEEIDAITSSENISPIANIYGTNNNAALYFEVDIGEKVNFSTTNKYGAFNKLYNNRYVKFTVETTGTYTIELASTTRNNPDPDFLLFQVKDFTQVGEGLGSGTTERKSFKLKKGDYLLDITDANYRSLSSFNLRIN